MSMWTRRQWLTAAIASVVVALAIGLPTDVIPNPVFGRPVDITWWSYPTLVVTAVLGGLLAATYVRVGARPAAADAGGEVEIDRPGKLGSLGGLLGFFAVGCPVCNKLVVIALGTTGTLEWFAPAQPILAVASIVLLAWALRVRLRGATSCPIPDRISDDADETAMMSR
jgi:H+/Cl- antiporter ClcA